MENNIDKWLKQCNNPSNRLVNAELSKGMQSINNLQPKPNDVIAPKQPKQQNQITNTQDIFNNSLDFNFLDENIDALLRHYETNNENPKEAINNKQHDDNISFHLFDENKESFNQIIKSNIPECKYSEINININNNKSKDCLSSKSNNDQIDSIHSSILTESIKFDSEDNDNCLKEFNCYYDDNNNDNNQPANALEKIEEEKNDFENELSITDINRIFQMEIENNNDQLNSCDNNNIGNNNNNQLSQSLIRQRNSIDESFVERLCINHQLADLKEWSKKREWDEEVDAINLQIFGFKTFRPNQREIINSNIAGRDIFVCMPTGGGKSLTFQIPAIIQFGVTLVIMPLLSLIQDQTSFLEGLGIKAIFLNQEGMREVFRNYDYLFHSSEEEDLCKLIFLTPEKISLSQAAQDFLQRLYNEKILIRVVIDEAHCVSQWGREFRPDYLHLKRLKKMFPGIPILAVTATAPNKIREDVIAQLGMTKTLFFRSSYNRSNLYIEIRNKKDCDIIQNIAEFIKNKYPNSTGLIYCSSKRNCEMLCQKLKKKHQINCEFYHANLPEKKKNEIQERWMNDDVQIIIATVAFGMGINKADVRFVIHHSMPKSFESYYQEIGRAGRDGNNSHCILYYSSTDKKLIEFLMSKTNLNQRMITENLRKTTEMIEFCEENCECRRVIALLYFDEKFNRDNCRKMCDNCRKGLQPEETDVTNDSITVLSLLKSCHNENVDMTLCNLVDYLRGIRKKIKKQPSTNIYFSSLKHIKDIDLRKIVRRLIIWKYIDEHLVEIKPNSVYTRIEISKEGLDFLDSNNKKELIVTFVKKEKKPEFNNNESKKRTSNNQVLDYNRSIKSKFDYSLYKYNKGNANNNNNNQLIQVENTQLKEFNDNIDINRNSSGNSRRYHPNYKKEEYDEEDEIFNQDEDYGYCSRIQFIDLFSQLKVKRIELLSAEKRNLMNQSVDGNVKKLSINDIFPDNGLKELCRKLPTNESELSPDNIFGVGPKCLEKYGKEFLYTIQKVIKIYQIEKSEEKINYNMRNINSSRLKQAKRNVNKKEKDAVKPKPQLKKIEDNEENKSISNSDEPINLSAYEVDRFICKSNEELDDYEGFNSFINNPQLDVFDNNPIDEPERKEVLSLCKEAKNVLKNTKKRKAIEIRNNSDNKLEDDIKIKKEIKVDKRAQYFKTRAVWKKINKNKNKNNNKNNKKFL